MSKDNLFSHFSELRSRAIYCLVFFIVAFACIYPFNNFLFDFLVTLLSGISDIELVAIEVASPFIVPLRLAGFLALLVSIPFFLYQALAFMAPGLYKNEKGIIFSRTILGTLLFFLGLLFCSFLVLPNVFNFFQSVGPESINITTDISKFLNFVLTLILAFGFAFQIPILVNAIVRLNIVEKNKLKDLRGIFLVVCFVFGAIFTPPDVISQFMLAVPMYILFELGLLFSNGKKA
ncbi:MAG: twin-arginine translocase subunit TatC [Amoebophilaceae bacterium TMED152]|nr:twin-arginine translocase subunit TatC [Gammaproteobacteria bacterium]RPH01963.1 MAG: twin-arginine translocase subunit TatC [Amoebophilaceae bacterium TMED152]|tara:strand:+ start:5354 stop:6055 length:702 start_codon:yes stop_codon:yes gene_type:complete